MSELEIPVLGESLPAKPAPAMLAPAKPAAAAEKPIEDTVPAEEKTPEEVVAAEVAAKEAAKLTPEQEKKREQNNSNRRMGNALRREAEQRARADFFEKRFTEQKPIETVDPGAPTLEGAGFDPEVYAKALAKYEVERTGKEANAKRQIEFQKQSQEKLISAWEEKSDRGAEKYEDWDEKVGNIKPDSAMLYAVFEAENGEDIAHFLGTNPKEAARIMGLHPAAQIREIGKLEAKLAAEPVKVKTVSKAPAPIVPVGGSTGNLDKKMSELSQAEFEKRRRATIAARR